MTWTITVHIDFLVGLFLLCLVVGQAALRFLTWLTNDSLDWPWWALWFLWPIGAALIIVELWKRSQGNNDNDIKF